MFPFMLVPLCPIFSVSRLWVKHRRSPTVVAALLLLILLLLEGASFGIYRAATGKWAWNVWHTRTSTASQALNGIAWSGSQFVVVGDVGTILTSPDGRIWTAQHSSTSQELFDIAWSGSQFVAVGSGGTILTSPWSIGARVPGYCFQPITTSGGNRTKRHLGQDNSERDSYQGYLECSS